MQPSFHPVVPIFKEDALDGREFYQLLALHWAIDLADTHKLVESVAQIKIFIRKHFVEKEYLRRMIDRNVDT